MYSASIVNALKHSVVLLLTLARIPAHTGIGGTLLYLISAIAAVAFLNIPLVAR